MRESICARHYSRRAETAYVNWIRRYMQSDRWRISTC
jgi:hypothetical protein